MEVQIHLLIGSISILFLAIFLAIAQYKEGVSTLSLRNVGKTGKREKRIYPRYETSLRIKYKISSEKESISWIKDISRGGIRLFLNNPFKIGTSLKIEINLPYDIKPIFAQGSIVWMKEKDDDSGLRFDEVKQEDLSRIIQYIGNRKQMMLLKK